MITGHSLTAMLHAISSGFSDRALNIVVTTDELEDGPLRSALYEAITKNETASAQARALGDAFRDLNLDQFLVNECYRAAFYLSSDWSELAMNPLYAHFIANRAGPVLDKWPHYFPIYAHHLGQFRGRKLKVLEIGVYRGGGLELWRNYLGADAEIVGLDIDEAAVRAAAGKYPVVLGDQADPEVLLRVEREYGPFDIVIDDGGHTMHQQIVSIETLFPLLNDGGVYLVEDCHTSYWPEFGGQLHSPDSFIEWSKRRADDMHSRHHHRIDRTSIWATDLDGLHVYDSVVVFDKKHRFRPFNEVVGTSSYLFGDRFSEALGVELVATRDAVLNERETLRGRIVELESEAAADDAELTGIADPVEELRLARAELRRSRRQIVRLGQSLEEQTKELESTRNQLIESWNQIKGMRTTVSWRLTGPLRAVRRLGAK
jgi:cephalosporin hydroxylase